MSDPPRESPAKPLVATADRNRLGIAHLLVWTAMTAILIAIEQGNSPAASPQKLSGDAAFDRFLVEAHQTAQWRQAASLVFTPAYGAAWGAIVLALWRLGTRRYGFPSQPGHWLLLLLGVWPTAVGVGVFVQIRNYSHPFYSIVTGVFILATLAAAAAFMTHRPWRWRLTFSLAAGGLSALAAQLVLSSFLSVTAADSVLLGLGTLSVGVALFAALGSPILDLTLGERYDIFHWIGVVVLFAFEIDTIVSWATAGPLRL